MKKTVLLFLIFINSISASFSQNNTQNNTQNTWKYKGEKNGIKGYTRPISDGLEMRFTGSSQVKLSAFIGVMYDVPNHGKWMTGIEPSTVYYQKDNALEVCYRAVVPFPWPMSNRDAIMKGTAYQDHATRNVYIKVRPNSRYKPENKGFVRLKTFEMDITLYPKADKTVSMDCLMRLGTADNVPIWLIDWLVTDRFFTVIHNLCERVKIAPYNNYTHTAIKN